MSSPLFLVTGFGPFENVEDNPTSRLVDRLDADPPAGVDIAVRILPVSFRGSVSEFDSALSALEPRKPDAILALGLNTKSDRFRLERRATTKLKAGRLDILGVNATSLKLPIDSELSTSLDLEALLETLSSPGNPDAEVSDDAGGYVCERLYHYALDRSEELGIPAVFLHVPPVEKIKLESQLRSLRQLIVALARQVSI